MAAATKRELFPRRRGSTGRADFARAALTAGVGFLLLGCASGAAVGRGGTVDVRAASPTAWVDSLLSSLSLRDKVAQLVWPWILGDYVPEGSTEWGRLLRLVREERVGGFIVSVGSPHDIAIKVNALQRESVLPLLIAADLETGVGFRARGGYFLPNAIDLGGATTFPLQMALGAAADSELAYQVGRVTAREARALGIHIAFGPVLDVNNNPANPVIGARSFSEDPRLAARLGVALIHGMQDHGLVATGKHFPGHGDTETNSHLALAVVTATRARLDSVELVPFKAAIAAGVGAIMTFHGFLPALDSSGVPATLSRAVMTDLLRRELGFGGLLVTDAMDMAGVVQTFGPYEAARRALAAGADVLLMPADVRGTIDSVVAGVTAGRYSVARIDSSLRRVLELKARFGLHRSRSVSLDSVRSVVGDSTHVALAQQVAERGLVLARDSLELVPVGAQLPGARTRILSVTYARRSDLGAGVQFDNELRRRFTVQSAYVSADDRQPDLSTLRAAAESSDLVVVGSYVNVTAATATAAPPAAFVSLVSELLRSHARVVLVSFGSPYILQYVPDVGTYLVAWGGSAASQKAAARALLGEIPITGRMPIAVPPSLPLGAGLTRTASR